MMYWHWLILDMKALKSYCVMLLLLFMLLSLHTSYLTIYITNNYYNFNYNNNNSNNNGINNKNNTNNSINDKHSTKHDKSWQERNKEKKNITKRDILDLKDGIDNVPWMEAIRDRFSGRNALLESMCKKLGPFPKPLDFPWLRLQYGRGIMACTIPKAGSSTMKAILGNFPENATQHEIIEGSKLTIRLQYLENSTVRNHIGEYMKRGSRYNRCQADLQDGTNYFKGLCPPIPPVIRVLTVRHPLERLISAYRDKFNGGENITIGQHPKFRHPESHGGLERNPPIQANDTIRVNFKEFLMHILSKENEHWAAYEGLCSPCRYKYDYIIHSETMDEDLKYIMHIAGLSYQGKIIHRNQNNSSEKGSDKDKQNNNFYNYFSSVTQNLTGQVLKFYKKDFLLFGYPIPRFLKSGK